MSGVKILPCRRGATLLACCCMLAVSGRGASAQVGSHQKISDTAGGFTGTLDLVDFFGHSAVALGDLDGDGLPELAVGAPFDADGGMKRGAVWVLFLNSDGTVKSQQKISDTVGGFTGQLNDGDIFGTSVTALGDLDGDGVVDLAVGAPDDDDGGSARGAVWILLLNADGTVKSQQKISSTLGGFQGVLDDSDLFGSSLTPLGDFDLDGTTDLAVGACGDGDGGWGRGAVWLLFLNPDGTVKTERKISDTAGGFTGGLSDDDAFGDSVAFLGDVNSDGVGDLAVGVAEAGFSKLVPPYFPTSPGAVWVLLLNADGSVRTQQKIGDGIGGFAGDLDNLDRFGAALAAAGDLDGDGVSELIVGAPDDDDGGIYGLNDRGAAWLLFLAADGTVRGFRKVSDTEGGFTGDLDDSDRFGQSVAALGDLDGDGVGDWVVGAPEDDDGGSAHGAVWVLFLQPTAPAAEVVRQGTPPNPIAFLPGVTSPPVVGALWDPVVTPFLPGAVIDFVWFSLLPVNLPTASGTLLCALPAPGLLFTSSPGVPFQFQLPADPGLVGLALCFQGGSSALGSFALANALDITLGSF